MNSLLAAPLAILKNIHQSIAYLTTLLIPLYLSLGLIAVLLPIDASQLPDFLGPLNLSNPGTARTLLATLIAGMFTLLVFSFSTVMTVFAQTGSSFSYKLVFGMVTARNHQWVLGHYLGTILFILMLLMVPVAGATPDLWRSLAIYLGVAMVIHCLALFVYFIHNTSQSILIHALTQGLHRTTRHAKARHEARQRSDNWCYLSSQSIPEEACHVIYSRQSGYIQSANLETLARLAETNNAVVHLNFRLGDYIVKAFPLLRIEADQPPGERWCDSALSQLDYVEGQAVEALYVNGLLQLMEIAVKMLSPAINEPGSARLCIQQITDLLCRHLQLGSCNTLTDARGLRRVTWSEESFDNLLYRLFNPILHYGGDDVSICLALLRALKTLSLFAASEQRPIIQAHAERMIKALTDTATDDPLSRQFIEAHLNSGEHRLALPATLPRTEQ